MKSKIFKILGLLLLLFIIGCDIKSEDKEAKYRVDFIFNIELEIASIEFKEGYVLKESDLPIKEVEGAVFNGWYFDESFINAFKEFEIASDIIIYGEYIIYNNIEEVKALNSIKLVSETYEDIDLPSVVDSFGVSWLSLNEDALTSEGKYKFVLEDTVVKLIASINGEEKVYEKEFNIIVKVFPYDEVLTEAASLITFPDIITSNISLKTVFGNGIIGSWSSSNQSIINNYGIVKKDKIETNVTLTLTLIYNGVSRDFYYDVVVDKRDLIVQDVEYFIEELKGKDQDVNKLIMNESEINTYNQVVLNSSGANVIDLSKVSQTINKIELRTMIEKYSNINTYNIFDNSGINKNNERSLILSNRNLDGILDTTNIQYAVSVTHTSLRSYPSSYYSNSSSIDRFQETGFSAGVPMIVYHQSLDNQWYYVRMYNYDGWIKASDIALCTRSEFLEYYLPNNFIVVLANLINIDGEYIRMGYKIPYASKNIEGYTLKFPKRDNNGKLVIKNVFISNEEDINDGYIPYTYTNLLTQGYKLLGMVYSWGDKIYNGLDCSSTMAAIYNTFGFILGRNTSNQWKTNQYGKPISQVNNEIIKTYKVGSMFYTSGHVLMYIGTDKSGNSWFLHNTNTGNICKLETVNSYINSGNKITNTLIVHN